MSRVDPAAGVAWGGDDGGGARQALMGDARDADDDEGATSDAGARGSPAAAAPPACAPDVPEDASSMIDDGSGCTCCCGCCCACCFPGDTDADGFVTTAPLPPLLPTGDREQEEEEADAGFPGGKRR